MIPTSAEPSTILVVDDTPENLLVLGEILQPEFRVRVANNGERALTVAATPPYPDLILLDVMMPQLDGYAVMERLRADPQTRDIPVIFVTALDGAEDEERGLALGAADYLQKPVRAAIVRARVRTQLMLRRTRQALMRCDAAIEAEVARRVREICDVQATGVRILASLAQGRSRRTARHIVRTQAYVELLARRLRDHPRFAAALAPDDLGALVQAVPLHDLPTLGLAATGAGQCEDASGAGAPPGDAAYDPVLLRLAREIAGGYREHWDGSGTPRGLAGEAIPVAARLLALADDFDALVDARSDIAPSQAVAESLAEILDRRGRHYDPDMVDALQSAGDELAAIVACLAESPAERRMPSVQ